MSTLTPNLNLVLPIGVEKVSRQIINTNMTLIDTAVGGKVNVSDIVNNLTTNDPTKVLSAAQGYALNSNIANFGNIKMLAKTGASSYALNIPSNSQRFLIGTTNNSAYTFAFIVCCNSQGVVYVIEAAKGTYLTYAVSTNTLTITLDTARALNLIDLTAGENIS